MHTLATKWILDSAMASALFGLTVARSARKTTNSPSSFSPLTATARGLKPEYSISRLMRKSARIARWSAADTDKLLPRHSRRQSVERISHTS